MHLYIIIYLLTLLILVQESDTSVQDNINEYIYMCIYEESKYE